MRKEILIFILGSFFLLSCGKYEPWPRPWAYPRIELPSSTSYHRFSNQTCPFTFEYPEQGKVTRDLPDSCWVDILMPEYDCKIHITYREVDGIRRKGVSEYEDYRKLVYKHSQKATQIKESQIEVPFGRGTIYELYGNVGTPMEVFLTDSTRRQVITASFYFQTALKNDSLAPVIDYMKKQMDHLLGSIRQKE